MGIIYDNQPRGTLGPVGPAGWADQTYGKNPVNLSAVYRQKEARLNPIGEYNDADRLFRKKVMYDMQLTQNDGNVIRLNKIPEFQKARWNILRRTGRIPLNLLEDGLCKMGMAEYKAHTVRVCLGAGAKLMIGAWALFAVFNDRSINNWEWESGFRMYVSKPTLDPDSPYYQSNLKQYTKKEPQDFFDNGFSKSPFYK